MHTAYRIGEGDVLLGGIVGSTAYGLARPGSDIDRLGVFAAPTNALLGLHPPADTIARHQPADIALHEARKFVTLALACNPTIIELLWLDEHEVRSSHGDALVAIRSALLSAKRVRDAYLGYATSQFQRLQRRADGTFQAGQSARAAKHAVHMARLLRQGRELYETGSLRVRVDDPDWYHEFREAGPDAWSAWFAGERDRFAGSRTVLPDAPNADTADAWLLGVRHAYLTRR